ncbi:hypothetical protein [Clostridium sp.]
MILAKKQRKVVKTVVNLKRLIILLHRRLVNIRSNLSIFIKF